MCQLYIRDSAVSSAELEMLVAPFTENEVKEAVWSCDGSKSPGPDGLNFKFLKEFWEMVKGDFMGMLRDFHMNGKLVRGFNPSFIVIIPKKEDAVSLNDYRPISLIESAYKVLSKLLARRLSKVVEGIISDCQSAFVGNRHILDGVVVLNEAVEEAKKKMIERIFLKIDFVKAYDSVDWEYLDLMMEQFNFCSKWRSWIKECISSACATILVNGSPTNEFKLE